MVNIKNILASWNRLLFCCLNIGLLWLLLFAHDLLFFVFIRILLLVVLFPLFKNHCGFDLQIIIGSRLDFVVRDLLGEGIQIDEKIRLHLFSDQGFDLNLSIRVCNAVGFEDREDLVSNRVEYLLWLILQQLIELREDMLVDGAILFCTGAIHQRIVDLLCKQTMMHWLSGSFLLLSFELLGRSFPGRLIAHLLLVNLADERLWFASRL